MPEWLPLTLGNHEKPRGSGVFSWDGGDDLIFLTYGKRGKSCSACHPRGPTEVSLSLRSGGKDDLLARHAAQVIRTPGVLRLAGVGAEGG